MLVAEDTVRAASLSISIRYWAFWRLQPYSGVLGGEVRN